MTRGRSWGKGWYFWRWAPFFYLTASMKTFREVIMVYLYQAYCLSSYWVHCGKHPLCLTEGAREQKGDWSNNSGEIQSTDLLFVNTRNCMKRLQLFQGRKSLLFSREFWWISMQFSSYHNSFLKEIVIQLNATPDIIRNVGENITTGARRKFSLLSCRFTKSP